MIQLQALKFCYEPLYLENTSIVLERSLQVKLNFETSVNWIETSIYKSVQNLIKYIEEIYILKNPNKIKSFLLSNQDLLPILLEAYEYIYEIFGKVPLYLEIHHDPEEEWDELFIVIKTSFPPSKAVELERKFFNEWFIKVLDKVNGRLSFIEEPL